MPVETGRDDFRFAGGHCSQFAGWMRQDTCEACEPLCLDYHSASVIVCLASTTVRRPSSRTSSALEADRGTKPSNTFVPDASTERPWKTAPVGAVAITETGLPVFVLKAKTCVRLPALFPLKQVRRRPPRIAAPRRTGSIVGIGGDAEAARRSSSSGRVKQLHRVAVFHRELSARMVPSNGVVTALATPVPRSSLRRAHVGQVERGDPYEPAAHKATPSQASSLDVGLDVGRWPVCGTTPRHQGSRFPRWEREGCWRCMCLSPGRRKSISDQPRA